VIALADRAGDGGEGRQTEHDWWHQYRQHLEGRFRQHGVVVRATTFERL
jgi:hypothetical protein